MALRLKDSIARSSPLPRDEQIIMGRAELLSTGDKDLVEAVLVRGQPATLIARIMGTSAKVIRARVRCLGRRLTSQRFLKAARALPYLDGDEAHLARLNFCAGVSQRRLARELGIPTHTLRRRLEHIAVKINVIHQLAVSGGKIPSPKRSG